MKSSNKASIRPLKETDAYTSVSWRNDATIWMYTGSSPTSEITIEDELAWIRRVISDPTCRRFAIESDGRYVGNVYLTGIRAEIAEYHIFIGEKDALGKGIAREATRLVLQYARDQLDLREVELFVRPENVIAVGLYESLGFKPVSDPGPFMRMVIQMEGVSE